jgi:hypothetical protein
MITMRAKMRVAIVKKYDPEVTTTQIDLILSAVGANGYPEDGTDENNTFSRWTPCAELKMSITNPSLLDSFEVGDEFYVDFTKADKEG